MDSIYVLPYEAIAMADLVKNKHVLGVFILSPCMLLHSILLPTLCTYLIKNYYNSHLKPYTLKMSVMHN